MSRSDTTTEALAPTTARGHRVQSIQASIPSLAPLAEHDSAEMEVDHRRGSTMAPWVRSIVLLVVGLTISRSAAGQSVAHGDGDAHTQVLRKQPTVLLTASMAWQDDGSHDATDVGGLLSLGLDVPISPMYLVRPEVLAGGFVSRGDLCIQPEGCGQPGTAAVAAMLVGAGRRLSDLGVDRLTIGGGAGYYRAFGGRGRTDGAWGVNGLIDFRLSQRRRPVFLKAGYHRMLNRLQTTYAFVPVGISMEF